jgi:uncharacterized membrane protein YccC
MPSATSAQRSGVWRAILRFDRSKARPWMGLRHTIGIILPLIAWALAGDAAGGMIAGIGALNVAVADGSDSYGRRVRRMLLASILCALAVMAGGIGGGTYGLDVLLVAAAFAAGIMAALGTAQTDLGSMVLVTLIVFSAKPVPAERALASGALALTGGLFQTALTWALSLAHPRGPESRALAKLYLALARAASAPSRSEEAPPASPESTEAQQVLSALDAHESVHAERYLALLSQAERIRLSLLALARLRVRLAREAQTEAVRLILERFAAAASGALQYTGESLDEPAHAKAQPPSAIAEGLAQAARELREACRDCPTPVTQMFLDARSQVDALAGQLRAVQDLAAHTTRAGGAEFERREAAQPWRLRAAGTLSTLAANLRVGSPSFRHGVRLSVCVLMGQTVARVLNPERPYWIPMTIALVLKPDFTTTFSRGWQRVLGTLAGLLISTALFDFFHPTLALEIAFVGAFALVQRAWGPVNYGILAIGVTGVVVFLFGVTGVPPSQVVVARGLNTLIGGGLALLAYGLWPTWERSQAPEAAANLLDTYAAYFRAVSAAYLRQAHTSGQALDETRLAARMARSRLEASLARMRDEPGNSQRISAFDRILADSHRLAHAMMSLEAGLIASGPAPTGDPFRTFADHVDLTLYFLSAGLRGSGIRPTDFPSLREDHHQLRESGDANVPRYALAITETDRIVNSLNTLTGDILPLVKAEGFSPP